THPTTEREHTMAITGRQVKLMLKEAKSGRTFKAKLREMLGIKHDPKTDRRYFDPKCQQIDATEISVRALTEDSCGQDFVRELHNGPASDSRRAALLEASTPRQVALFEDAVGVDPSAMQDINAWTATVAGLVEVKLLQGYNAPEFIGNEFVEI